MKINRIALSLMILGLSTVLIFSCKKPNNAAPEADTETSTAVEAVWATFVTTDVEQISAFLAENSFFNHFYRDVPGSLNTSNNSGTITVTRDTVSRNINIGFNNSLCYDGRYREGTLFMFYNYDPDYDKFVVKANKNARYAHDYGFVGKISFSNYKVDKWQVDVDGGGYAVMANIMPENYVAKTTKIQWRFQGSFNITNEDLKKSMNIKFNIVKTLDNSSDDKIYNQPVRGANINWTNFVPTDINPVSPVSGSVATVAAKVLYTGTVSGTTTNGEKFRLVIDDANPLVRDFTCYADKVGAVVSTGTAGIAPRYQEFHPFIKGIASFTTGLDATGITNGEVGKSSIYPRQIYFGNEDNPALEAQCDNSAFVLIKGIGYNVDLKK